MDAFFTNRVDTSSLADVTASDIGTLVNRMVNSVADAARKQTREKAEERAAEIKDQNASGRRNGHSGDNRIKDDNGRSFRAPIGYPPPPKSPPLPGGETGIRFALPPEDIYAAKYNSGAANPYYYMVFDEALRDSWANALAMRRDGVISELMFHRQLAVASLDWNLMPDDPKDKDQMAVVDQLTEIIRATSRFKILIITLLEDIHFGKFASQTQFGYDMIRGKKRVIVNNHTPVQGDKITFGYDGTPRIQVWGGSPLLQKPEYASRVKQATFGRSLSLEGEYFRDRFIISKFIPSDYDYIFEGDMSLAAHGIGMRSRMYWTWNIRVEVLTWITDALQRVGANGMTLGAYEYGSAPAKAAMTDTMKTLVKDNYATVGIGPGKKIEDFILNIPVTAVGYEVMIRILEYLDSILRRAYLGQELTSTAAPTGMGSGTASVQKSMFDNIVGFDSDRVGETLDNELIKPLLKYNTFTYRKHEVRGSDLPFKIRFSFTQDSEEVQQRAETAKTLHEIGVPLDVEDVRDDAGFAAPEHKDQVLPGKPEEAAQKEGDEGNGDGSHDGETPTSDLSPIHPRRIKENAERSRDVRHHEHYAGSGAQEIIDRRRAHSRDLSFYRKSLDLPEIPVRNRGVEPSDDGKYPPVITRRDVSGILSDQYGNILARERGMSAGEEDALDNRWISSNKFYLMEVPIDIAIPSHRVKPSDHTHSSGPMILDANIRGVGKKFEGFGFDPEITVLDGKHRQAQWIREGKRTAWAYVGDKVLEKVKRRIADEGDRINKRLEKFEAAQEKGGDGGHDDKEGVMVCLRIPRGVASSLPFGQPILEADVHVTLAYLGKTSELSREVVEATAEACKLFAEYFGSFNGEIKGLGRFPASESSDWRGVIWAGVDVPGLAEMRAELVHVLELSGVGVRDDHGEGWTPHVTLDYVDATARWDVEDYEFEPVDVRFDSMALVVGGKWNYYYFK